MHGGSSPQVKAAAEARVREIQVRDAVARFALPRDVEPGEALLEELARTQGVVDWYGAKVAETAGLEPVDLIHGVKLRKITEGGKDGPIAVTEVGPIVHMWLTLWMKERRHLTAVAQVALTTDADQRRTAVLEREAEQIGELVAASLDAAGVTGDARDRALSTARDRLVLIMGESG